MSPLPLPFAVLSDPCLFVHALHHAARLEFDLALPKVHEVGMVASLDACRQFAERLALSHRGPAHG
jgi:hypothetical protein